MSHYCCSLDASVDHTFVMHLTALVPVDNILFFACVYAVQRLHVLTDDDIQNSSRSA